MQVAKDSLEHLASKLVHITVVGPARGKPHQALTGPKRRSHEAGGSCHTGLPWGTWPATSSVPDVRGPAHRGSPTPFPAPPPWGSSHSPRKPKTSEPLSRLRLRLQGKEVPPCPRKPWRPICNSGATRDRSPILPAAEAHFFRRPSHNGLPRILTVPKRPPRNLFIKS